MQRKQMHFVRALARGLAVLEAFTADRPEMSLSDLAKATGMNLTATQRLTDTLLQLGFLKRDQHKQFILGPKVLALGFSYLGGSRLRLLAQRHLEEFSREHDRTVNMAVLDGEEVVFLVRAESQRFLKFDLSPGSRLPAQLTAQGKVLMAALPDAELDELLGRIRLEKVTAHTIVDRGELRRDLLAARHRGLAVCDRELSLDLYSLGAPLLDVSGTVVAAVNLSLRADEAKGEYLRDMTVKLVELGRSLSSALGYGGPYPLIPVSKPSGGES